MKVVAIIQARMGSTRLKNKMLLDLCGAPLMYRLIERVERATTLHAVVVAVPRRDASFFAQFVMGTAHLYAYDGDEADLVGRYLSAAKEYEADLVVRIPGDNPCVDPAIIDEAVTSYLTRPQVYVSTLYRQVREHTYVDGVGAEVFSYNRLQWLDQATRGNPLYREHPHLLFQDQHLIDGWEQYQRYANLSDTIRLDVNTMEEYVFIQDIYDALYPTNHNFTITNILAYLAMKKVPV